MSRQRYTITLEPTREGPPPEIRLRMALKALWRRHGLRCVDIRENLPPTLAAGEQSGDEMTHSTSEISTPQKQFVEVQHGTD